MGGDVLRSASQSAARAIGAELDLTTAVQAGRHLRIEGGYGYFRAGDFLQAALAAADDSDWLFASATLTF